MSNDKLLFGNNFEHYVLENTLVCKGGGGGGGSSGAVSWPSYQEWGQRRLLYRGIGTDENTGGVNVESAILDAYGNSPYANIAAYDPDGGTGTPLAVNDARYATFDALVAALDPETDWETFVSAAATAMASDVLPDAWAKDFITALYADAVALSPTTDWTTFLEQAATKIDEDLIPEDGYVDDVIDAFDDQQTNMLLRYTNRFASGMRDINAVCSSAFVQGIAYLQNLHARDVAKFGSDLRLQLARERVGLVSSAVDQMAQMNDRKMLHKQQLVAEYGQLATAKATAILQAAATLVQSLYNKIQVDQASTSLLVDMNRIAIVARKERTDVEAEYTIRQGTWDLELFQYACNVLAAIQGGIGGPGGATMSAKPSGSALGGALSGGASGALGGAMIGGMATSWTGPGALIGAGVGALVGGLGGYAATSA